MSTRVVVLSEFGVHAHAWDQLVRTSERPSLFQLSSWLDAAAAPTRAAIVAVFDGGHLIGGLPLERELRPGFVRYRVLGYQLSPDHVDLVAANGATMMVVDAVANWFTRPGHRFLELVGVAEDALVLGALARRASIESHDIHRLATLPATYPQYIASRPRSLRSSVSRATKRLQSLGVSFHRVATDPMAIDEAVSDLFRLHRSLRGSSSQLLPHANAYSRSLRAAVRAGDAALFEARVDGRCVAVDAWSVVGPVWATLQGGREDRVELRGLGRALVLYGIEQAIERGATAVDFLRGYDSWKKTLATETRSLYQVRAATTARADAGGRIVGRIEYEYRRRRSRAPEDVVVMEDA